MHQQFMMYPHKQKLCGILPTCSGTEYSAEGTTENASEKSKEVEYMGYQSHQPIHKRVRWITVHLEKHIGVKPHWKVDGCIP